MYLAGLGQAEGPSVDGQGNIFVCTGLIGYVRKVTPQGQISNFVKLTQPNGSDFDALGNLFVCDPAAQKVFKVTGLGDTMTVADRTHTGALLSSPNDITVAFDGTIFFTDNVAGAIYFIPPGGQIQLFANAAGANGLTLNLAQDKLIVGTGANNVTTLYEWTIGPTGGANKRFLLSTAKWSDGMETDTQGNYWFCLYDKGKAFRITSAGQYLDTIALPTGDTDLTNLTFSGADNRTVYLTDSRTQALFKVTVDVPGVAKGARAGLFSGIRAQSVEPSRGGNRASLIILDLSPSRVRTAETFYDIRGRRFSISPTLSTRARSPIIFQPD